MNSSDIASIIKTLTDSGFDDAELKMEDLYLKVSNRPGGVASVALETKQDASSVEPRSLDMDSGKQTAKSVPSALPLEGSRVTIASPTLGTFYHAPSPGADPFVEVGDRVSVGQQVGIVEVMKLFTSVDSDVAGTVVEILVADATLVEYGQALITIAAD